MDEEIKLRVAGYARVSTGKQAEDETIEAQKTAIAQYCAERSYELVEIYEDNGWSGTLGERPDSDRLAADAMAGRFKAVVIVAIDRVAREPEFFYPLVRRLEKYVKVIYIQTPIADDKQKKIQEFTHIFMASMERERIVERFKAGKREKLVVRKQFMGHRPPYGYRYIYKNKHENEPGHLEIDEKKADIVRMIFRWIGRESLSANEAIRRLAQLKITSPRGYPAWTKATFLAMLKNESYLGRFFHYRHEPVEPKRYRKDVKYRKNMKTGHKLRPREQWALVELPQMRLVDDETFALVQEALKRNRQFSKRNTKRQTLLGGGLISCESCGGTYYAGSIHGRDIYKCGDKLRRFPFPQACAAEIKSVSAPRIETVVWRLVERILSEPDFLLAQLEKHRDMFQKEKFQTLRNLELIDGQIADKETEEKRLVVAVQKGVFRDDQIAEATKKLNLEKAFLIGKRKSFQEKLKEVEISEGARKSIRSFCAQASVGLDKISFEEKQEVVRMVIKRIHCNGRRIRVQFQLPIGSNGRKHPEILVNPIKPVVNENRCQTANNRLPSTSRLPI